MEEQINPYEKPKSPVVDNNINKDDFARINPFGSKGRMGRLRYFYYSMVVGISGLLVMGLLFMFLLFIVKMDRALGVNILLFFYIVWMLWFYLITIQRCHDFNMTGWLSALLLLFPLSLVFYFIPGTKSSNKYGLRPPPNSKGVIAGSIILPVLLLLVIASVLGPAIKRSQDNAIKAQQKVEQQSEDTRADLERLERYIKEQDQ